MTKLAEELAQALRDAGMDARPLGGKPQQLGLFEPRQAAALLRLAPVNDAVPALERALRLGPRDPYRAEWQYRLALAHFGAGRYELARDWSQTAANTTPTLRWPPIHAAALLRLGLRDAAQQAFDEHMRRHPGFAAGQVTARFPSEEAAHSELRSRLIESLRELGMRD